MGADVKMVFDQSRARLKCHSSDAELETFRIQEECLKIDDDDEKISQLTKAIMHEFKLQL